MERNQLPGIPTDKWLEIRCHHMLHKGGSRYRTHLPMHETQVRSLGQEDPLEEEMMTYSNTLVWEIPWTEDSGRLQTVGSQESDMT